ncbi:MAG: HAMP domain-containing histidine kinase [Clostridiales bacterium]|nr:HAMP domain-containing histidine kinase [Clostridiales bacterium]
MKGSKKNDYTGIKKKVFLQIFLAMGIAVIIVLMVRFALQGFVGNLIVRILEKGMGIYYDDALLIYQVFFRNNMEVILFLAITGCFLLLCNLAVSRLIHYFDEANKGIDALIKEDTRPLELSPEMEFFERKLNTLKKALEMRDQEAKLAEQRKNDLVMYLAHDVKTPLTSVIGYLSLLDEAQDIPQVQTAKYLRITLEKAHRIEKLIDEFFEIARYNLQTITLSKQNIDLYYMLAQMTDEFYPLLASSGKEAILQAPKDLTVYGDPDKLARVFNNILKNAAAYGKDNSAVEIYASRLDGMVKITFKNSGSIPKNRLDSIFDKFYRLDDSRSSKTGGSGLGLAIAKEIVVQHGGKIFAESDGNCTTFTIELPVVDTERREFP